MCCCTDVMWNQCCVKHHVVVGCGIGCDHGQMWWPEMIQLCKMRNAVQPCCVKSAWCDAAARCGGARHNVANIWCDLKCGVMWNVM